MKIKIVFIFFLTFIINSSSEAQFDDINVKFGDHTFKTMYDTGNYATTLRIYKDDKRIFKDTYVERIDNIREYDLNNDGKNEILIEMYSGGAHCCTSLYLGKFIKDKFIYTDTIFWGNSYYSVEDLNKDGKLELSGSNDFLAYAFTNYAESRFPVLIYGYEGNQFINVTADYKDIIRKQIEEFRQDLISYTDTGFTCPAEGEDTFNTDAGTVKTILAAIVADYLQLGEGSSGYELVDSVYKCNDRDKFKEVLKNDYKLK